MITEERGYQIAITGLLVLLIIGAYAFFQMKQTVFDMCRLYCDVQGGLPISNGFNCKCLVQSSHQIGNLTYNSSVLMP